MEEFQGNIASSNSNLGFQVGWRTSAEGSAPLLPTKEALPLSLVVFYCLGSLSGINSVFSTGSFSFSSSSSLGYGVSQLGKEEEEGEV